jgi:hypothetical protein
MHSDIDDVLAFELKKEIADRYFGFRKMIEEDKMELSEKIRQHSLILEKRIVFELVRIYILLADEKLINEFTSLIGWEQTLYYDPYLAESPTISERVFKGIEKRGITKAGRFKNLFFDSYERLEIHVDQYRQQLQALIDSREVITEEIELFYKKNDIGNIMCFLRGLNSCASAGPMLGSIEAGLHNDHEKKMRVEPPLPIEQQLPTIHPLVSLGSIRKKLRKLVDRAYKMRSEHFLNTLVK